MANQNGVPAAVEAARNTSTEAQMESLKTLNNILIRNLKEDRIQNDLKEDRIQNEKLCSEVASLAAERDIRGDIERDVFSLVFSYSFSEAASKLLEAERRLRVFTREKDGLENYLERTAKERDLSRSDLDEKWMEEENLKASIRFLEQALDLMSKEREVADAKCGKLEEELKYAMREKDFLERCLKDNKQLVEKLVREMVLVKIQEGVDMDILIIENEENGSKIYSLEEERRFLKEIRAELENELSGVYVSLKKLEEEKVEAREDHKRNMTELVRLKKEKVELQTNFDLKEKETTLQINELKRNMTKMAAEKDLVNQTSAIYEIQIRNLQAEMSELQSARKSIEDAHSTCSGKIAYEKALRAAMENKMNQTPAQKTQLQNKLDLLTTENEDAKKRINSLTVDTASLVKQLQISNRELQYIEKRLKSSEDASGKVFSLLKKMTAEVMDAERTQVSYNSSERKLDIENYDEMKQFLDNLDAIKLAVKDKDAKIKDLNQELELLQASVAFRKNKWGMYMWLLPATTTIFAAVSFAYAARAR